MRSFPVLGVRLDDLTNEELHDRLLGFLNSDRPNILVTPNPEFLLTAQHDTTFRDILNTSDLALPDGVALQFAVAALHGVHGLHRHTGVDVLPELAKICRDQNIPLVLLGATDIILASVKLRFATLAEGISIITFNPGIIEVTNPQLSLDTLLQLRQIGRCAIAVALGQSGGPSQGKQEKVAAQIAQEVPDARIVVGVGGALDMIAGTIPRAPKVFRRLGMEWLWRLYVEPWRYSRIFRAVIVFPLVVFRGTITQGRWFSALIDVAIALKYHFFSR